MIMKNIDKKMKTQKYKTKHPRMLRDVAPFSQLCLIE